MIGGISFRVHRACHIPPSTGESGQTLFARVEKLIDKVGLGSHTRASKNSINMSEKARSSYITRIISSRSILSAVQYEMAMAVAKRVPSHPASDSSPMKSPE